MSCDIEHAGRRNREKCEKLYLRLQGNVDVEIWIKIDQVVYSIENDQYELD